MSETSLVALGHQSWMVEHGGTRVLVDPMLLESFGTHEDLRFVVYPHRRVCAAEMPPIDAVLLTNEHLDHFHLPSLALLDRGVLVVVGTLMPDCVVEAIGRLGLRVARIASGQPLRVGALELRVYQSTRESMFWEKRVYNALVGPPGRPGVFFQSDAVVSRGFTDEVAAGRVPCPRCLVVTNNAQIVPPGARGTFDNMLPSAEDRRRGSAPLRALHEVVVRYTEALPASDVVIHGGGYLRPRSSFGPYAFSDHREVARLLSSLSMGTRIHGLDPGERLEFAADTRRGQVSWVQRDLEADARARTMLAEFVTAGRRERDVPQLLPDGDDALAVVLARVEAELAAMAPVLLMSRLGRTAVAMDRYLGRPLGAGRFAIRLRRGAAEPIQYVLDVTQGRFVRDHTPVAALLRTFPFGIDCHLADFDGLLTGRLQIWELATCGLRQWYVGTPMESCVAFAFGWFGEQLRPELAERVLATLRARCPDPVIPAGVAA